MAEGKWEQNTMIDVKGKWPPSSLLRIMGTVLGLTWRDVACVADRWRPVGTRAVCRVAPAYQTSLRVLEHHRQLERCGLYIDRGVTFGCSGLPRECFRCEGREDSFVSSSACIAACPCSIDLKEVRKQMSSARAWLFYEMTTPSGDNGRMIFLLRWNFPLHSACVR